MRSPGRLSLYACALMLLAFPPRLAGQNAPEVNVLHSFTATGRDGGHPGARLVMGNDGAEPEASLAQDNDGNFYGKTWSGGRHGNGTVFRPSK